MSIWEVRSRKQNYTYSKVMLWVAFDRGLRLAEKRCLPCPNRARWMETRDEIYEEIMAKGASVVWLSGHASHFSQAIVPTCAALCKATRVAIIWTLRFSSRLSFSSSRPTILASSEPWTEFFCLPRKVD